MIKCPRDRTVVGGGAGVGGDVVLGDSPTVLNYVVVAFRRMFISKLWYMQTRKTTKNISSRKVFYLITIYI